MKINREETFSIAEAANDVALVGERRKENAELLDELVDDGDGDNDADGEGNDEEASNS